MPEVYRRMKSKKGVVFSVMLTIIATVILTTALLQVMDKQKPLPQNFGERSRELFLTYQKAEKDILYAEQAAKLANCSEVIFQTYQSQNEKLKGIDYQLVLINKTCVGTAKEQTYYNIFTDGNLTGRYEIYPSFRVKLE